MSETPVIQRATRIVPLVVACPLFMVNLDSSILLTAIPTMAKSLGVDAVSLTPLISAYLIALAVSMPVSGWFSDRLGSRQVFIGAVVIFTLGSLLCAFAPTLPLLIAARVVQGLGGGLMTPVARIVLLKAVPKSELVSAMAWYTTPALLGPVIGPSLGGLIVEHLSWSFVFLVNIPFGLLTLFASLAILKRDEEKTSRPFDVTGFLLLSTGLVVALLSFDGINAGDSRALLALLGIGIGLSLVFAYTCHAVRTGKPLIGLSVLGDKIYASTLWGGSVFRLGTAALPFLLSIVLQGERHLTPSNVGFLLSCMAFGAMSAKPVAPVIIRRLGYRTLLVGNAAVSSLIMAWLALASASSPVWLIGLVLTVSGLSRSVQFTALNSLAYYSVPNSEVASASTLQSIAQQVSIGFGVVLANLFVGGLGAAGMPTEQHAVAYALVAIALVCATSIGPFCGLDKDAGQAALGERSS